MSNRNILQLLLILPFLCVMGCTLFKTTPLEPSPKPKDRFGEQIKQLEEEPHPGRGRIYHEVRRGETLTRIARNYGVSRAEIARANNLIDENKLEVGQRLLIPLASGSQPNVTSNHRRFNRTERGFIWPLKGKVISHFDPDRNRTGIKISTTMGQKVRAAKSGVVVEVIESANGWGKVVIIDHGDGFSTWYAYNSRILARRGDRVKQGEVIAEAGQSGRVNRPQLSFRIYRGTRPVDPLRYLPRR